MFGVRLHQTRLALLDQLPSIQTALFLGDGDGRLLEAFCKRQPHADVTSIDQSPKMLASQRCRIDRLSHSGQIHFELANAIDYKPPEQSFDLIVSAYFLDCFTEQQLRESLPRWLAALKPDGKLYYVDFCVPDVRNETITRTGRFRFQLLLYLMHRFFAAATAHPTRTLQPMELLIESAGFQPIHVATEIDPMCTCKIYQSKKTALRP